MKREDFQKWINEDLSDNESEIFEKEIMNNLLELRLQQEFKQRLQARRVRQFHIKWGLILLAFLGLLSLIIYGLSHRNNANLGYQEPTPSNSNSSISDNEPFEMAAQSSNIKVDSLKKVIVKPETTILQPIKTNEINSQSHLYQSKKLNLKSYLPPKDTEYIYMHSVNEPISYYPKYPTNNDVQDPYFDIIFKDFRKQKLTSIPPSVFLYKQLKTLLFNNNLLTQIPSEMSQLTFLENLNLRNNKLESLPIEISQLRNLKILDLGRNKLKELPDEIKNLRALEDLNLSSNRLSIIPLDFEELSNLKSLNLRDNVLTIFPLCIEKMTQLTSLDLRFNRLTEIPEGISNLMNLTNLDLGNNRLKTLPEALFNLKNLKFLNLSGNNIPIDEIKELEEALPDCRILDFR